MNMQVVKNTLVNMGIQAESIVYNPDYDLLFQGELEESQDSNTKATLISLGAVAVDTGLFTGRSPKDKYIVRDEQTKNRVWWSDSNTGKNDNHPISKDVWNHLKTFLITPDFQPEYYT